MFSLWQNMTARQGVTSTEARLTNRAVGGDSWLKTYSQRMRLPINANRAKGNFRLALFMRPTRKRARPVCGPRFRKTAQKTPIITGRMIGKDTAKTSTGRKPRGSRRLPLLASSHAKGALRLQRLTNRTSIKPETPFPTRYGMGRSHVGVSVSSVVGQKESTPTITTTTSH